MSEPTVSAVIPAYADRIYDEVLLMLEPVLLVGLHGPRRWVWRGRILSFQAHKAALTSREAASPRELGYISRSLLFWLSPFWLPVRYTTAASLLNALRVRRVQTQSLRPRERS